MLTFLKASLVGAKLTQFTVDSALFKNLNHFSLNNTVSAIVEFISHHMAPDVFPFYFLLILFISFSGTYTFQFSTSPPLFGRGSKFLLTKLSWAKNLCGHCLQNRWGEFYFLSGCVGWMVSMCDCMTCSERCLHSCINTTMLKRFWDFL